tara:strand:+ start:104 stop:748 length:645 start_codon:yes stop_codon:yes gene_type:complete
LAQWYVDVMRFSILILLVGLFLSGCETVTYQEATGYNFANLNKGMSKSQVRRIYTYVIADSDPTINSCDYEYFSDARAEILSSKDQSNHLVFVNVDERGSCTNNRGNFHSAHNTYEAAKKIISDKQQVTIAEMINESKNTCKLLGMKEGTDKFSECALKLYTQKIELAAKENQKVTSASMSGTVTINDPARDSRELIEKGQRMISGACTLGIDC